MNLKTSSRHDQLIAEKNSELGAETFLLESGATISQVEMLFEATEHGFNLWPQGKTEELPLGEKESYLFLMRGGHDDPARARR